MFKYDWIWQKQQGTNSFQCKWQPMKSHEFISVFSESAAAFSKKSTMSYYPQYGVGKPYKIKCGKQIHEYNGTGKGKTEGYISESGGKRYPKTILRYNTEKGFHPSQKPVDLLEYLIKTYTLENETVLDFTMGSGSTGVACKNLKRKFIGIENNKEYFKIAINRIRDHQRQLNPA